MEKKYFEHIEFDINNERKLDRFNPNYICDEIIKRLESLNSQYSVKWSTVFLHRRNILKWEKNIKDASIHLKWVKKTSEKLLSLSNKIEKEIEKGNRCTKNMEKFNSLFNKLESEKFDFKKWHNDVFRNFEKLVYQREKLIQKNKIGLILSKTIFNHTLVHVFFMFLIFSISFIISFSFEELTYGEIEIINSLVTKFIIALFSFLVLDRIVNNIQNRLNWYKAKWLYRKMVLITGKTKKIEESLNLLNEKEEENNY